MGGRGSGGQWKWARLLAREAEQIQEALRQDLGKDSDEEVAIPKTWQVLQRWAKLRCEAGRKAGYLIRKRERVKETGDAEAKP